MRFLLQQSEKHKKFPEVELCFEENTRNASFYINGKLKHVLHRAQIDCVSGHVMQISGFEMSKSKGFIFQKWWLRLPTSKEATNGVIQIVEGEL